VHQVHSADAVYIDAPWPGERPHADALVTTTPGLVLSVLTADCGPILLADAEAGVIAAAHAGWRGAFGGVLQSTIALMQQHGAEPKRMRAALGPCIQQRNYEVGEEFRQNFMARDTGFARFFSDAFGPKPHFDLSAFCAYTLESLGVGAVEHVDIDTFSDAAWFSHRRSVREGAPRLWSQLRGHLPLTCPSPDSPRSATKRYPISAARAAIARRRLISMARATWNRSCAQTPSASPVKITTPQTRNPPYYEAIPGAITQILVRKASLSVCVA
jgi:YfiH family protein